jgi:hypothetical protein
MTGQIAAAADSQIQALRIARENVAAAASQQRYHRVFSKGGPQLRTNSRGHELERLERDIDGLISDLERGKSVAPGQIDQTLRRADEATR